MMETLFIILWIPAVIIGFFAALRIFCDGGYQGGKIGDGIRPPKPPKRRI